MDNSHHFPVVEVQTIDTTLYMEYVADIQALKNVEVRARMDGFIDQIFVDEGQEVKKGQLLFQLNNTEQKARVKSAQANLSNALAEAKAVELEFNRIKTLVDKNVLSKSAMELAHTKYNAAQAKVDDANASLTHAKVQLSYTTVRSPFSGVIDRLPLKAGSMVEQGALLTSVSDLNSIYAYFNMSENEHLGYLKSLRINPENKLDKVKLLLADGAAYPSEGKIETSESVFKQNTGSIAFRARFPNPSRLLKHGSTGKVHLPVEFKNVVVIPEKAVIEIQDKNYLYVVGKDNKVRMTAFVPGRRFDDFFIVESGVHKGDRIVYEGVQSIKDGLEIKPQVMNLDSLLLVAR